MLVKLKKDDGEPLYVAALGRSKMPSSTCQTFWSVTSPVLCGLLLISMVFPNILDFPFFLFHFAGFFSYKFNFCCNIVLRGVTNLEVRSTGIKLQSSHCYNQLGLSYGEQPAKRCRGKLKQS